MKAKHLVTGVLLLFVVGSVAYMMVQERRTATASDPGPFSQAQTAPAGRRVIVYYFHGDTRCVTCHKLETYARQAVESGFSEELQSGRIVWKAVNIDCAENAHFIQDYKLVTKAVILSEVVDGRETAWKNLDQIWNLVDNENAYLDYIRSNLKIFLEKESS